MTPSHANVSAVEPVRGFETKRAPAWVLSIICLSVALYLALFVGAVWNVDDELLAALTLAPILIGLTIPVALRIARADDDPTLVGIVIAGIVLKLLAAYVRFYVAFDVYKGHADATQYHEIGIKLAPNFRSFDFTTDIGSLVGTGFIKIVTGAVYAIVGTSRISGFFFFSWLGFLGLLLLARAFRMGVPEGSSRRYTIAVLFFPTLVYWPSAIGKEAWMMLGIGLSAYGIACLFRRRTIGAIALGLGLLAVIVVRPHVSLIIFVGLVFALLVRRAPARTYAAPLLRVLGLGTLLVLGLFLASQTASFLGQPSLTSDIVSEELSRTEVQTSEGGSSFTPVRVNNPIDMVPAFFTVFFRPLPFEASGSAQELATSAEGVVLLGLFVASRKRLRAIPRLVRSRPYVAFCAGYLLAFVFAFSSFANFGILARQRTQALPFLLVFLAIPRLQDLAAPTAAGTEAVSAVSAVPAAPVTRRSVPLAANMHALARRAERAGAGNMGAASVTTEAGQNAGAAAAPGGRPPARRGTTVATQGTRRRRRPPRPRVPVSSGSAFPPPPRGRA